MDLIFFLQTKKPYFEVNSEQPKSHTLKIKGSTIGCAGQFKQSEIGSKYIVFITKTSVFINKSLMTNIQLKGNAYFHMMNF